MAAVTGAKPKLRQDPANRLVDGARGRAKLVGKDPDKHYVFANRSHPSGEQYYTELGYEVVRSPMGDEPGVRLWNGRTSKPGEPIEQSGHVLMCLPMDQYRELVAKGDGDSVGQDGIDFTEQRIVNRERHTVDGLRGIGNYIRISENSTTGEQAVIGG